MTDNFNALEPIIHYHFTEVNLLKQALTHSSYANECPDAPENNERMEFLGDAVLELCITEELVRRYPGGNEGFLTKNRARLVRAGSLAEKARQLRLEDHLLLGRGEESQGGRRRDALLSDAFEALLGAIFMDGGYAAAKNTVLALFAEELRADLELQPHKDFKSRLQEACQKTYRARPLYALSGSRGPEHSKIFEVTLSIPDGRTVLADGSSVKRAEQNAARKALQQFFAGGSAGE